MSDLRQNGLHRDPVTICTAQAVGREQRPRRINTGQLEKRIPAISAGTVNTCASPGRETARAPATALPTTRDHAFSAVPHTYAECIPRLT